MDEECVFIYPTDDTKDEFLQSVSGEISKKGMKIAIGFAAAAAIFLLLYCLPFFKNNDFELLVGAMICGAFLTFFFRYSAISACKTALAITAYEDRMQLEYYTKNSVKKLNICYEDIADARFSDGNFTSFQIAFAKNSQSFIEEYSLKDGKKIQPLYENLFLCKLNPFSFEQFFFLYIAENYFTINRFHKTKKFFKTYGDQNEYLEKMDTDINF